LSYGTYKDDQDGNDDSARYRMQQYTLTP